MLYEHTCTSTIPVIAVPETNVLVELLSIKNWMPFVAWKRVCNRYELQLYNTVSCMHIVQYLMVEYSYYQGLEVNNHQYRLPHTAVYIPYHYRLFRICPWPETWLTAVEVISYRLAPVHQPVTTPLWLLSTKFRRWLFEKQYLHIPCSICIYQNAGVGAMMCLYRIGVESTLCCIWIMQMCRICVESGLAIQD